jgi:hypothetical protein
MAHALDDTISHYGADTKRRVPNKLFNLKGECCALGRFADVEQMLADGVNGSGLGAESLLSPRYRHYLHHAVADLPVGFLRDLTQLHDTGYYWNPVRGLSISGKRRVREIITSHGIGAAAQFIDLTPKVAA